METDGIGRTILSQFQGMNGILEIIFGFLDPL
jgi:hypothetical protein